MFYTPCECNQLMFVNVLITHADGSHISVAINRLCDSVCLSGVTYASLSSAAVVVLVFVVVAVAAVVVFVSRSKMKTKCEYCI